MQAAVTLLSDDFAPVRFTTEKLPVSDGRIMRDLERVSISPLAPIRQAIAMLDDSAIQIVLVVDSGGALIGTVTDGDIRRGLLRSLSVETPVEQVMFREFRSLSEDATDEEALSLMRRQAIQHVPALDESGRVSRLILLKQLLAPKPLSNWVVLMAGGEGRRMLPLTENDPKPMLRVASRPLLEITLERCVDAGFNRVFIAVSHMKQQIIDHFADGSRWGISISYIEEEQPLGTAGALSLLTESANHPLLVINADVLTRVNLTELMKFHDEHGSSATVCVRSYETQVPFGVVTANGLFMESMEEKPILTHLVNAGIYVIGPEVVGMLTKNERTDMPDLLAIASSRGLPIGVFPIHEYWRDVGNLDSLFRANDEWR
ncbi:MAG: UTP--glucose-1-phosphate uridylyltransferase [Nitrospira sp.]|nr:UTP--glucose-1-phosphate uridylyltransferase [Nitrospira sp.]